MIQNLAIDNSVHAAHPHNPAITVCGVKSSRLRPSLKAVTCERCGPQEFGLDEFESWDSPVALTVVDNGDSVSLITRSTVSGIAIELDARIRPGDLDRLIEQLTEIKKIRGL